MRISKSFLMVLFPAFLVYYVAVADAALQGHRLSARPAGRSAMGRLIPRLPESVTGTLRTAMDGLREKVLASGLMTDTRPSPEQARRDFAALWADLEGPRPAAAAPSLPAENPGYPVLEPGQD